MTDRPIDVELWGPPGAGRTVLLAALYETLDHLRDVDGLSAAPALLDAHARLLADGCTLAPPAADGPSDLAGEQLTVTLPDGRPVRVVAHGGDDLRSVADPAAWARDRAGAVVVACFNPFLLDADLAWVGLRQMTAALQALGHPLPAAIAAAAAAILHVDADAVLARDRLRQLLPRLDGATLRYDPAQPDPELRFDWGPLDPPVRQQLVAELRRLAQEQVRLTAPAANVVRRAVRHLDRAVVVLTHADLIDAVLPAVTSADLGRVFDDLFAARPARLAGQQVLARPFHVEAAGESPAALVGRLRPDGAIGVVHAIRLMATDATPAADDGRLRAAEQRAAELSADVAAAAGLRERLAERDAEFVALRDDHARLRQEAEAARRELAERAAKPTPLPAPLPTPVAPVARPTPPVDPAAVALRAELAAAGKRFEELRSRTHEEIARRDETIQSLGEQVRAREMQVSEERNLRKAAERGGLGADEAAERQTFEAARTGPGRAWAAVLVRAVPAVPVVAVAAAPVVRAMAGGTLAHAFVVASAVAAVAAVAATAAGVYGSWRETGPRWVWLRSRNDKAGLFDVLTSGGERVQAPPREFSLEVSPLLELFGHGTVRRSGGGNGLTYATTEPDAWRAQLDKPQVRRRWAADAVTVVVLLAWAAAVVVLAA